MIEDRNPGCALAHETIVEAARESQKLGLFPDFADDEEAFVDLLKKAYPVEPTTLFFLPKIAARVAQNERTLFTFLQHVKLSSHVTLLELYDYFAPSMQADTSVGGTYRRWIETESALSKLSNELDSEYAIKSACLLSLGIHGERTRARRALLGFALKGYYPLEQADEVIESLIERKLLLHRKHSDEVTVWHGTDIDLRSKLNEEMQKQSNEDFDLIAFLNQEARPPAWRPVQYNDNHCIHRYFAGGFADMETLVEEAGLLPEQIALDLTDEEKHGDGFIWYVIAGSEKELEAAVEWVGTPMQKQYATRLIVLPKEPIPLARAAFEIKCLLELQKDDELLGQDPLVSKELMHMLDDARAHLQQLIDRLIRPGSGDTNWYYQGKIQQITNSTSLRTFLSKTMTQVYNKTPIFNNELIVKNHPTKVMINARKKLVLGILERYGSKDLGLDGNRPDASLYRTILCHTGLYRQNRSKRWTFSLPGNHQELGVRKVWELFNSFFTEPSTEEKSITEFIEVLTSPPYGVRKGLLPILFASAFRAFPSPVLLLKGDEYLNDLLPSDIELICSEPDKFTFKVYSNTPEMESYVKKIYSCFADVDKVDWTSSDFIRACYEAIEEWKARLPEAAFKTNRISQPAKHLRQALRRTKNPVVFLFQEVPKLVGVPTKVPGEEILSEELEKLEVFVQAAKELEVITELYQIEAADALKEVFGSESNENCSLLQLAKRWKENFAEDFIRSLKPSPAKNLFSRISNNYKDDGRLVDSLSSLFSLGPAKRWDDMTHKELVRKVREVTEDIVREALKHSATTPQDTEAKTHLAGIIREQIGSLVRDMVQIWGNEKTKAEISKLISELLEDERNK